MIYLYPLLFNILFFVLFWIWSKRTDRYLVADLGWSIAIPINMTIYYTLGATQWHLSFILVILNWFWGIRLAHILFKRFQSGHEDRRYVNMKNAWGKDYPQKFLGFFMLQALVAWLFASPFNPSFHQTTVHASILPIGVVIFIGGLYLEWLADIQVVRFRKKNQDPKGFCQTGLWRYSRHPNYFFEWVSWIGMALAATAFEGGYWAWITVVLELIFILFVSGIPFTKQVMLESRGQAYQDYMDRTSLFIPWFPKKM